MEFLRDILEEHLEEADFLYTQRRSALSDDDYDLDDLTDLEERLLAHIDGLIVAGDEAWELLSGLLSGGDEGEAFTAALVALGSGNKERRLELLTAFGKASEETLAGLREAFGLWGLGDLADPLRDLVSAAETETAAAVLDVLVFHRAGLTAEERAGVLESEESKIRIAGLRAAAAMGWQDFADRAAEFLSEDDAELVAEAVRAGFILGDDRGLKTCRALLAGGDASGAGLQIWLGLAGRCEDLALLSAGLDSDELGRGAAIALGWLGYPEAVDKLLEVLDRTELARPIGEAVGRITGVDLAAAGLVLPDQDETEEESADADAAPEPEDDDFADPVEDPDEHLAWPDPEKLKAWWQENRANFKTGHRHRYGSDFDREALLGVLQSGGLAERHLVACELARMSPGDVLLETRSLAWAQNRRLVKISGG